MKHSSKEKANTIPHHLKRAHVSSREDVGFAFVSTRLRTFEKLAFSKTSFVRQAENIKVTAQM